MQRTSRSPGFTLMELILVVLILGVLGASVLPRVLNLGASARIAAVQGLASTMHAAANLGRGMCVLQKGTCRLDVGGWSFKYITHQGKKIWTTYGWPTGWGAFNKNDGDGALGDLMVISSDFEYQPHVGGSFQTVYQHKRAPDPSRCAVIYQLAMADAAMSVTTVEDGC